MDIVGSGRAVGSWARPHHITAPRERKKPIRQPPGVRLQTTGVRSVRDYKSKAFLLHGSALSASAKSLGLLHYPQKLLICLSTCLFLPATSDQLIKCNLCSQHCPSNKSCKCAWPRQITFTLMFTQALAFAKTEILFSFEIFEIFVWFHWLQKLNSCEFSFLLFVSLVFL